jgi:DNA ligase-1
VFLRDLLLSELRQGALEGLVVEAVARAARLPAERVRRAVMFSGQLRSVVEAAMREGEAALAAYGLELFRPLSPMLAQPSEDGFEGEFALPDGVWEYKVDGARVQIHRDGERVEVYTRRLNSVTERVPELVEFTRALPCQSVVLDGEAVALRPDGSPDPFQVTMSRFGRSLNVEAVRAKLPLVPMIFDCLHLNGLDLVDAPLTDRKAHVEQLVEPAYRVVRRDCRTLEDGQAFFQSALAAGHEGVMVKSGVSPYQAGKRGRDWLKIKQAHSLDLVVIAAEWGSGRRKGRLSNLHLAARGATPGEFVMLGKTFKGMTDAVLEWQTKELLARQVERQGHVVVVRPELIVEVVFDGVQESPHYPGGMALRFARIRGYRHDKAADDADSIDTVRALFEQDRSRGQAVPEESA